MSRRWVTGALFAVSLTVLCAGPAAAQATPVRMTFREAISRALDRNPSVKQAAEEILRAQALLQQVGAGSLPSVAGAVNTTSLSQGYSSNGVVITPQNQVVASIAAAVPIYAPVQWAQRTQAMDNKQVAELASGEVKRQVAYAAAQAYLAVVARMRVADANERARVTALAHYEYARQRRESGAGSRLNELRAQQSLSSVEVLTELGVAELYRAQEALGVLVAADGPVAAADEPVLDVPAGVDAARSGLTSARTDLRLATGREKAAERVFNDSWKDRLPSVSGVFAPQALYPSTTYPDTFNWRFVLSATVPIFDGGLRSGRRAEREVLLKETRIAFDGLLRQANSEVRTAENYMMLAERAFTRAQAAAQQAHEVVDIVNVSYKVGASTNIEVIDAQRSALDADYESAVAEDRVRQARLALLVALGRFPQ